MRHETRAHHGLYAIARFELIIFDVESECEVGIPTLKCIRQFRPVNFCLSYARRNIIQYNHGHSDFPLRNEQIEQYIPKSLVYALLWSFAGDAKLKVKSDLGDFLRSITTIPLPVVTSNMPIIDFEVSPRSITIFLHPRYTF